MFENGSEIVKVDFHMHTAKDKEFKYADDPNYYISKYIEKMNSEGIRIGVITNHNKFAKDEYDQLRKNGKKQNILILPGVELSVKEGANGVHTLIAFNPSNWLCDDTNKIEIFLNEVFRDTYNRENDNTRCKYDLPGVVEVLDRYNSDYFIILAHVEEKSGFFQECNGGLIQSLSGNPWFKKRVLGFQKVRTRDRIRVVEEQMGYIVPHVEGSDCKNIDDIGKTNGYSEIKMGHLSFETLKFALLARAERVYPVKPFCNYSYISSVSFEGGLLNGINIGLSTELNTFIGIRGSGKSAIIEIIRYALSLHATVDEEYKDDLVKFVLGSGGVVCLNVVDEHGKKYQIRRIFGENPYVLDSSGNVLGIDPTAIVCNPVYFGQKDLALAKPGYEFELLNKLLVSNTDKRDELQKCENDLKFKLDEWYSLEEIPNQIEEQKGRLRELKHKIEIFEERGVSAKLVKQTAYAEDLSEIKSIIQNCNTLLQRLDNVISFFNELSIMSDGYSSKFNQDLFARVNEHIVKLKKHFSNIQDETDNMRTEIGILLELQDELELSIDQLKEEFAEIRRDLSDTQLDIDAFGQYKEDIDRISRDIQSKNNQLNRISPLKSELTQLIVKRNELLHQKYSDYCSEIERVNSTQNELILSIEFKGDKKTFLKQLQDQFKGSGISEAKYTEISKVFTDFISLMEDVVLHEGEKLKKLITANQYSNVVERVKEHYSDYIILQTPDKVEIKYHGKTLSRHSTGQRASALALFILAQKDNDVIIIDQPEDDLDNQVIYTEFIKRIKEKKSNTQFIFATHNANIPVLGDAERIVSASFTDSKMEMSLGTIDEPDTHKQIIAIMEGGQDAFQRRNAIYNSWS